MLVRVVAVFDSAVGAFNRPFYAPALGAAIRSFNDEVNRKAQDNEMSKHPDDFWLSHLADFDDEKGQFINVDVRVVARGKDVKQDE